MKKRLIYFAFTASVFFFSMVVSAFIVTMAYADVTFTSTPDGQQNLDSNTALIDWTDDVGNGSLYPALEQPDSVQCNRNDGSYNENDDMILGTGAGSPYTWTSGVCGTAIDWQIGGVYIFKLYNDSSHTSLAASYEYCNTYGSYDCGLGEELPPEEDALIGGATSTIDQSQENLYHGYILMFCSMAIFLLFFMSLRK